MWIKLLMVPYRILYPSILVFCCIGVYSISNSPFDVMQTAAFARGRLHLREARMRAGASDSRLILGP